VPLSKNRQWKYGGWRQVPISDENKMPDKYQESCQRPYMIKPEIVLPSGRPHVLIAAEKTQSWGMLWFKKLSILTNTCALFIYIRCQRITKTLTLNFLYKQLRPYQHQQTTRHIRHPPLTCLNRLEYNFGTFLVIVPEMKHIESYCL
jgi:hypothetical protein